ncbi:hypothetical protein IQ06DRAFT_296989 [Phaeosphaeriaceae sp. SRC1lsM3a]|nr:hypothetical protein IQ06DRAFT_296989 [Stagonospora sp. SRC1lsM3a]
MASIILLAGVAIYYSAEKIHERNEKKRELKALQGLLHGPVEEVWRDDDAKTTIDHEHTTVDDKERLPSHPALEQHPAFRNEKKSKRHFRFRV